MMQKKRAQHQQSQGNYLIVPLHIMLHDENIASKYLCYLPNNYFSGRTFCCCWDDERKKSIRMCEENQRCLWRGPVTQWRMTSAWILDTDDDVPRYIYANLVLSGFVATISQFGNHFFPPKFVCGLVHRFFLHKLYIMICCRYLMHEYRMEKKNSAQRICYVDHGYVVNIFIISGAECRLLVSVWYVCALT